MKSIVALWFFALLDLLVMPASAQEKSVIAVKGAELNNGVVIVEVVKAGKSYELQCNEGMPGCAELKAGKYKMAEMPSNSGMYDCHDVQIFPESAENLDAGSKIGEYCMHAH